jgi:hypothetical protein
VGLPRKALLSHLPQPISGLLPNSAIKELQPQSTEARLQEVISALGIDPGRITGKSEVIHLDEKRATR